jgi:membrane-bound ClpP family serine protease
MSILFIILIILTGLALLVLEVFVIPGFTITGVAGFILLGLGIYLTYTEFGSTLGHISVAGSALAFGLLLYVATRNSTWKRMALHTTIDSSVEAIDNQSIKPGDTGMSVSRLNPIGRARINDQIIEARCPGHFINENTSIEVVKVFKTHVIVKSLN